MAEDVIDILAKLSFDVVGNDDLQASIDKLQKHANVIEALKGQLANFQKSYENALSPEEQAKYARAIDQTTQSIQAQTQALTQNFNNNKKLQTALKDEIGVIGQLNKQLDDLVKKRSTALSEDEAKKYSVQINNIKSQLKDIFNPGSGSGNGGTGNILTQILGFSSGAGGLGRQLLTGSLIGLGFGGGFGIITRVTSGLVDYAKEQLDVIGQTEKLEAANQKLSQSFEQLSQEIDKIGETNLSSFQYENSLKSIDALQREADAVKALGVVNGETYAARERDLDAQNKAQEARIQAAQREEQATKQVLSVIQQSARAAQEYIGRPDVIASSANQNPQANKNVQFDIYQQTLRNFSRADLPPDVIEKLTVQLNKNFKDGGDIIKILNEQLKQYETLAQTAIDKTADATAKEQDALKADAAKTAEDIYQLSEQLRIRITKGQQDAAIERNNIQEAELNNIIIKTAALLDKESELRKANLKVQLDEANNAVDEEIKLAEKNGTLTTAIEQQFNDVKLQNLKKYHNQVELETIANNERLRQLAIQQTAAANSLSNNQDTRDLARTTTQIGAGVSQSSQLDFIQYKHQVDEQNQILLNQFYDYYQQQYDIAAKANVDTTELDERFDTDYRILKEQQYQNRLNAFQKYTDDFISIAEKNSKTLSTVEDAQAATVTENLSERLGKGLSREIFDYKNVIDELLARNQKIRDNLLPTKESEFGQAKTQFNAVDANNDIVQNNPNSSSADKAASQAALNTASNQVNELDKAINDLKSELKTNSDDVRKKQRQQIIDQINDYQELVNAAVQAFDAINEARQKSLDVEISIRTQQLNQANVLAERGNTSALKQQQELLDKAEQQKELAAKREIEVNEALTVSNSILTIAKAAAEGGAGAAFTIAAAVIALGVGLAEATSLAKRTNGTAGFAEGGYTGEGGKYEYAGPVHRGEFVFNQQKTRQYRPLFEALHKGEKLPPIPMLKEFDHPYAYQQQMDKADIKMLGQKLDALTEVMEEKKTEVHTNIGKQGISQMVIEHQKSEWRRFNA